MRELTPYEKIDRDTEAVFYGLGQARHLYNSSVRAVVDNVTRAQVAYKCDNADVPWNKLQNAVGLMIMDAQYWKEELNNWREEAGIAARLGLYPVLLANQELQNAVDLVHGTYVGR